MSHRKSFNVEAHVHFLTFSCYQRQPMLTGEFECATLVESLQAAREIERFALWAYVIMPEHVHLLIHPREPVYSMASILRRIKEPVSRRIIAQWRISSPSRLAQTLDVMRGRHIYRLWQPGGGFDRNLYTQDLIPKAIDYIEWNPVRRGLTDDPGSWRWSSAAARAGMSDAPLRIDPVEWELTPAVENH